MNGNDFRRLALAQGLLRPSDAEDALRSPRQAPDNAPNRANDADRAATDEAPTSLAQPERAIQA